MSAKDYQEDPLALLDQLASDQNVFIHRSELPWDKDITLVDFGLKSELLETVYSQNRGKPA